MSADSSDAYNRAADLFLRAVDKPVSERGAFLDEVCAGDSELRARVEEFLLYDAGGALLEVDRTSPEAAPESPVGSRVSRYRVGEKIGEGGMSVVYRGEDETLGRPVALKFLSPLLAASEEARGRFLREARAAAAIDHPNVCAVHEINVDGDRPFIAMAYLEGRSVAELLAGGPLPVEVAIDVAIQTCRGLRAAHAQGVVHRDVKPSNLMLVRPPLGEGRDLVKILDFGIASYDREKTITRAGSSLGTAAYMSPEQILSEHADQRADLWAVGVTLYEMLAGRRAFERPSLRELTAAITAAEPPPLAEARPDAPGGVVEVVERLLRKSPDERYDSAEEVEAALERVRATVGSGEVARAPRAEVAPPAELNAELDTEPNTEGNPGPSRTAPVLAVAAIVLAATGTLWFWRQAPDVETERVARQLTPRALTSYPGKEAYPTLSPDGRMLAFSWTGEDAGSFDLYVRPFEGGDPVRLTDYPEPVVSPTWSPDGERIAFMRRFRGRHEVRVIPAAGGEETLLRTVPGDIGGPTLDWSPAGDLLAVTTSEGIIGIRVEDPFRPPIRYGKATDRVDYPKFDLAGERLAYMYVEETGASGFEIIPVSGDASAARRVRLPAEVAGTLGPGPFDWSSDDERLIVSEYEATPMYSISVADGRVEMLPIPERRARAPRIVGDKLVYHAPAEWITHLWSLDLRDADRPEAQPLIEGPWKHESPRFSADGSTLVFVSDRSGSPEVWRSNAQGGDLRQLTSVGGGQLSYPASSPDGRRVVFGAEIIAGNLDLYVLDAPGAEPRRLTRSPARDVLPSWSADGRWIYFSSDRAGTPEIWAVSPDGGDPERVTSGGGWESRPSGDGRFLYYTLPEPDFSLRRLDLRSGEEVGYPELGAPGVDRFWAPSAEGVYFLYNEKSQPEKIQYLDLETRAVRDVLAFEGFTRGDGHIALSPDGQTLIVVKQKSFGEDVMLVEGVL